MDNIFGRHSLPLETSVYIFSFLSPSELGLASRVSKLWNSVASDDSLWWYHFTRHYREQPLTKILNKKGWGELIRYEAPLRTMHLNGLKLVLTSPKPKSPSPLCMQGRDFVGWAFINNWQLIAWNTQTGRKDTLVAPFQLECSPPLFIGALNNIDALVVAWPNEGKIHLWRYGHWEEPFLTWDRPGHPCSTWTAFSQDQKSFIAAGDREGVMVWEINELNKEPPMRHLKRFPIGSCAMPAILKGCRLEGMSALAEITEFGKINVWNLDSDNPYPSVHCNPYPTLQHWVDGAVLRMNPFMDVVSRKSGDCLVISNRVNILAMIDLSSTKKMINSFAFKGKVLQIAPFLRFKDNPLIAILYEASTLDHEKLCIYSLNKEREPPFILEGSIFRFTLFGRGDDLYALTLGHVVPWTGECQLRTWKVLKGGFEKLGEIKIPAEIGDDVQLFAGSSTYPTCEEFLITTDSKAQEEDRINSYTIRSWKLFDKNSLSFSDLDWCDGSPNSYSRILFPFSKIYFLE